MAQLMPTRSNPMRTFERPTGISCPSFESIPSAAYPPGAGRYPGKSRGSTSQIQYGMPSVSSVPIDPNRKCSSSEAKNGAGSVRKKCVHVNSPPTSRTTAAMAAIGASRLSLLERAICCSSSVMGIKLSEGQRQQHRLRDEEHQVEVTEHVIFARLESNEEDHAREP